VSARSRAAVAVIAAVVSGAILLFGVKHVPSFPDVADQPEPAVTGTIAYLSWGEAGPCLHVRAAAAAPEAERVRCALDQPGVGGFAFRPDGTLAVYSYGPAGTTETVLDPDSLHVVSEQVLPAGTKAVEGWASRDDRNADGVRAVVERRGEGSWRVVARSGDSERELLATEGPDDYWVGDAWWSPDGRWVLVTDSERRVLLLSGDGGGDTRVLVREADQLQWFQPEAPPSA